MLAALTGWPGRVDDGRCEQRQPRRNTMSTIIIGADGSARTEDAIAFARTARRADRRRSCSSSAPIRTRNGPAVRRATSSAGTCTPTPSPCSSGCARVAGGDAATLAVADRRPRGRCSRRRRTAGASLIVVGSTHRGPAGRVLAGTTADRLLHGAPCAVAVVPHDFRLEDEAPIRHGRRGVRRVGRVADGDRRRRDRRAATRRESEGAPRLRRIAAGNARADGRTGLHRRARRPRAGREGRSRPRLRRACRRTSTSRRSSWSGARRGSSPSSRRRSTCSCSARAATGRCGRSCSAASRTSSSGTPPARSSCCRAARHRVGELFAPAAEARA